jgi:phage-related protein
MPRTEILLYRDRDVVPVRDWLDALEPEARRSCQERLSLLALRGHDLRRPAAAPVVAGLFELRVKHRRLNLRMLYFFHRRVAVIVSNGFLKQQAAIPLQEIRLALERKTRFEADPLRHASRFEG